MYVGPKADGMPLAIGRRRASSLLLEGDHVRPAQCRGFWP
jgi:hypothetical protein